MRELLEREYGVQKNLLFQEITIWEEAYRRRKCDGKSDEQLQQEGWWKDEDGEWYSFTFANDREKKFAKKLQGLITTRFAAFVIQYGSLKEPLPPKR
jgi:hypothetical protein